MHTVDGRKKLHLDDYIAELARFEAEGFRRIWATQMPNDPDALTVLAVAGREVPRIEFATGVLPIQPQHPMNLAQRALTVNAVTGGRLVLGIGLTHQVVTEGMWGIPYNRPVRRMAEFLDGLLPLLSGEAADAAGDLTTTRGAMSLTEVPAPPVYLAALGPQMLKLAGARTAGTVTWMTGPKTLRDHIVPSLRTAAESAGRAAGDVRTVAFLPVAVTDDVDGTHHVAGLVELGEDAEGLQEFALGVDPLGPLDGEPRPGHVVVVEGDEKRRVAGIGCGEGRLEGVGVALGHGVVLSGCSMWSQSLSLAARSAITVRLRDQLRDHSRHRPAQTMRWSMQCSAGCRVGVGRGGDAPLTHVDHRGCRCLRHWRTVIHITSMERRAGER